MIKYTAYDKFGEYGSADFEGYPLMAKTCHSARKEAKKLASEKGWKEVGIKFFLDIDWFIGEIDV